MAVSSFHFRINLILRCAVTACVSLVVITCLSVSVCAAGTTYSTGYYYYEIEDGAVVVTGYFGNEEAIEIPSSMAGYPVSEIGSGAFVKCTKLKKITLPDTIMTIAKNAFRSDQEVIYPERLAKERDKAIGDEEQTTGGSSSGNEQTTAGQSSGSEQTTAGQSSGSGSGSANSEGSSLNSSGSGSGPEADGSSEGAGQDGSGAGAEADKSGSSGSIEGSDPAAAEENGGSGAGREADITDSLSENGSAGTSSLLSGSTGTIILVIAVIAAAIAAVVFVVRKKK